MKPITWPPFSTDKFEPGETFWSPDGKTWVRGEPPPVIIDPSAPVVRVVDVDHRTGTITVK